MTIRYLPQTDYVTLPWKNGTGSTDEVFLQPDNASRDRFDLRISRATISEPSMFSSFEGVDRTITLVEGDGLRLAFEDQTVRLTLGQSYSFDSGLTPVGSPSKGVARVVNVMASRTVWNLAPSSILIEGKVLWPQFGGLIVVFAVRGAANLIGPESMISLNQGDCAVLSAPAEFVPEDGSSILSVPLWPVGRGE